MIEQLRTYYIRSEHWDEWQRFFRQVIVPAHARCRIPVVRAWADEAEPQTVRGNAEDLEPGVRRFFWVRHLDPLVSIPEQEQRYYDSPERTAAGPDVPAKALLKCVVSTIDEVALI